VQQASQLLTEGVALPTDVSIDQQCQGLPAAISSAAVCKGGGGGGCLATCAAAATARARTADASVDACAGAFAGLEDSGALQRHDALTPCGAQLLLAWAMMWRACMRLTAAADVLPGCPATGGSACVARLPQLAACAA
jgi:hypothetical protein